jgi:hypothetical protein
MDCYGIIVCQFYLINHLDIGGHGAVNAIANKQQLTRCCTAQLPFGAHARPETQSSSEERRALWERRVVRLGPLPALSASRNAGSTLLRRIATHVMPTLHTMIHTAIKLRLFSRAMLVRARVCDN